jgi:hypothetical protein
MALRQGFKCSLPSDVKMNWQSDVIRRSSAMLFALAVGGGVALCCAGGDVQMWWLSFQVAPWHLALATAARLFLTMMLAVVLVACIRGLIPQILTDVAFWLGKALAFYPATLLVGSFLGAWVGHLGYPIWTLMPVLEPEASLSFGEAWARWSWAWIPVVGLAAVPLTGQCLSLCLENDARARDVGIDLLGFLALLIMVCVEDVFSISGAGVYLATAVRQSESLNLASAVWLLTAIGFFLAAILSMSESWLPENTSRGRWSKLILGSFFKISAWCLPGFIMFRGLLEDARSGAGGLDLTRAFDDPASILPLGLPWMLGATVLWGLGRFIQSR